MENGSVVLADSPSSTPPTKTSPSPSLSLCLPPSLRQLLAKMENDSVVLVDSLPSTPLSKISPSPHPSRSLSLHPYIHQMLANMENGSVVLADTPPSTPLRKIIMVSAIATGVQFGWALQLSLLTPYVQQLGVPHMWTSFIWLCGPVSGLLVQPIVGYYSDRCTSRIGRRRPFIIGGAVFVALSVFLIGFAADIGHALGDDLSKLMKPRAVAIFVVGFWILDVANNMLQGPCRAFQADLSGNDHRKVRLSNGFFAFFMAVGNFLGYGAGSFGGLHKFLPFTETKACDVNCANLKTCFIIEIFLLVIITVFAVSTVSEIPFVKKKDNEKSENLFHQLWTAFKQLSRPMWILFLVTAFNWIAWFSFLSYDTDWMGLDVYGGKPTGTSQEVTIYNTGVRAGSLGLVINSIVLALASLAVEPISRALKGAKNWWGIVNLILAVPMCMTLLVTRAAEQWRSANGLHTLPSHIKAGAFTIFAILGIPLSVNYSVPWALASIYSESCGTGQGLSVGLLNLVVVIPQMIVSMVSGPLDAAFGGGNSMSFVMGGIAAAISAVLALTILPKTSRPSTSSIIGGH